MDISIIILNYKSKGHTLNCIKSIKDADFVLDGKKLTYEIIVIDNNSGDSIGEILNWQYGDIKFIQNESNLGMGAGNNVGIRKAKGEYIAAINPDIIVFKDVFVKMYEYMEKNKKIGIIGPQQLSPDKSIQYSCYRWHKLLTPVYRRTPLGKLNFAKKDIDRLLMKDFDHKETKEVDWLLGSFSFCRTKALKQTGLFDERFFMYLEDTDLCRRFWNKNWLVIYFPKVKVIHNHARESAQVAWYKFFTNPTTIYHIKSWIKYIIKWKFKTNL
ncbi:glycosyltransferase family 2 protein [Candidatus Parcubacteria bacterium]|nr:glycosyltransferase family 2 protein [Candidatus Parcubacteria bacterium]